MATGPSAWTACSRFYQNVNVNTYLAKTDTPGVSGHDWSYRAQLDYNADRYGLQLERLVVDRDFNPDVGFLARQAFRRSSAYVRFSPRPSGIASVRKFTWDLDYEYIADPDGRLESRAATASFRTELESGDSFGAEVLAGATSFSTSRSQSPAPWPSRRADTVFRM